jgi:two-component system sensor histidine kinase VicK
VRRVGPRGLGYNLNVRLRLRVWMPLAAVLTLLLSVALMFLYGVPATERRLAGYAKSFTLAKASTVADKLSGVQPDQWQEVLDRSVGGGGQQALVVDRTGRIVARAGPSLIDPPPERAVERAARGNRMQDQRQSLTIATVPLTRKGSLVGGVVFISERSEGPLRQVFLRSAVEAAAIASVFGGGLMLLLGALLSRRIERLTLGARAIEGGDFSSRIEPGPGDELGELARSFNAMAARLQDSFSQLAEKGATLDAVVNNMSEGVLAADLQGEVVFANDSARALLGISGERIGERPSDRTLGEVPDAWEDFDLPSAVVRCAKEGKCNGATVRDAETFLRVTLERMPAFDDHRGGVLVVLQDLSEGRRLEANQQRFLANAAHELKTPITSILGASELLLTGETEPDVRRRFLQHIYTEAGRMQRLSETLLRLARTGQEAREPNLEPVDLGDAVGEATSRMRALAESAGLVLVEERDDGRALADREWLDQVLLILINNAIQHSDTGGKVWVRARQGTGWGAVVVEDEGSGIPEEELPRVFERFYRGRGSSGGFGLGLPICKELVERMGGEISLSSTEGVGTRIKIRLPEGDSDA